MYSPACWRVRSLRPSGRAIGIWKRSDQDISDSPSSRPVCAVPIQIRPDLGAATATGGAIACDKNCSVVFRIDDACQADLDDPLCNQLCEGIIAVYEAQ